MKQVMAVSLILVGVYLIMVGLLYFPITNILKENPIVTGREKCENAGGLYFDGGFGTPNCVFPPQENIQPARGDLQ